MRAVYDVIKRPVISEKSTALAEVANRFIFEVDRAATKQEIKSAVQQLFNVKVKEVRTMVMHGKFRRVGRSIVKRPNWKKAIISLAEGQTIPLFQNK